MACVHTRARPIASLGRIFSGVHVFTFLGYKATNKSQNAPSFLDSKSYAFQSAEITRLWAWL